MIRYKAHRMISHPVFVDCKMCARSRLQEADCKSWGGSVAKMNQQGAPCSKPASLQRSGYQ